MPTTLTPPAAPPTARSRRRRSWWRFALGTLVVLGSFAGCVAWVLPFGQLAEGARAGGVGGALDEALHRGDAGPLGAYVTREPGARFCFVREFDSLRYPPLGAYWRTYGLPNLQVPDGHWAVALLRAGQPPEFAVVPTQRLILSEGNLGCTDAARLRLFLSTRSGSLPVLRASAEP